MARGKITIDDAEHDLSHLDPFTVTIPPKGLGDLSFKVLISFGHHTFTKCYTQGKDNPAYYYIEENDGRCFCPDRFLASKGLPGLIKKHLIGKVYFSNNRNYMIVDQPLGGAPYAVFFNIEKNKKIKDISAVMFIVSAYEKPGLPPRNKIPSISFTTLVAKTVRGEKITKPKK